MDKLNSEDISLILDALNDYKRWYDGDEEEDKSKVADIDATIKKVEEMVLD